MGEANIHGSYSSMIKRTYENRKTWRRYISVLTQHFKQTQWPLVRKRTIPTAFQKNNFFQPFAKQNAMIKAQIIRGSAVSSSIHSNLHIPIQTDISCILKHISVIDRSSQFNTLLQTLPDDACYWWDVGDVHHTHYNIRANNSVHLLIVCFLSASLCTVNVWAFIHLLQNPTHFPWWILKLDSAVNFSTLTTKSASLSDKLVTIYETTRVIFKVRKYSVRFEVYSKSWKTFISSLKIFGSWPKFTWWLGSVS
jgi:hypothetical protein